MLKNTLSVHISWGHCDPAKIVFYPNYFIWFDQSAHHLFDKAGANMGDLMDQYGVVGLPIVDAHAEFLYPSKYGDVIEVCSWISEWREKTLVATGINLTWVPAALSFVREIGWVAKRLSASIEPWTHRFGPLVGTFQ